MLGNRSKNSCVVMSPLTYGLFVRSPRYVKKTILEISTICLRLFYPHALISNENSHKSTDSVIAVFIIITLFMLGSFELPGVHAEEPSSAPYVKANGNGIIEPGEDAQEELARAAQNPVVSQPATAPGTDREFGIGDTTFTAFLSPRDSGKWIWGAGPALLIPTNTDDYLGPDKWGAGSSLVFLTMPGNSVVGSLFSNVWSFGGSGDNDVNLFTG
jgi:hypothetical protein